MINCSKILITGGAGALGRALTAALLRQDWAIKEIVIFSRDEQKHWAMAQQFPPTSYPIRYILGDIRDSNSLVAAMRDIDLVIHTAAMKHIPQAEANPWQCILTNVLGSKNVIDAALNAQVKHVVGLSSDKACYPSSVYGTSKQMMEKLFISANQQQSTRFSIARYANVFGTPGSVVPLFLSQRHSAYLPITHPEMTRFSMTVRDAVNLVLFALQPLLGCEIIIPIVPSYHITTLASAIAPTTPQQTVGLRAGEKLAEVLLTHDESQHTVQKEGYYIVCPPYHSIAKYCQQFEMTYLTAPFDYHSAHNTQWLSIEAIQTLLCHEYTT